MEIRVHFSLIKDIKYDCIARRRNVPDLYYIDQYYRESPSTICKGHKLSISLYEIVKCIWNIFIRIDFLINSQILYNIVKTFRIFWKSRKYLIKVFEWLNDVLQPSWLNFSLMIKHSRPLIHNHVPVFSYNGMIGLVLV